MPPTLAAAAFFVFVVFLVFVAEAFRPPCRLAHSGIPYICPYLARPFACRARSFWLAALHGGLKASVTKTSPFGKFVTLCLCALPGQARSLAFGKGEASEMASIAWAA